MIASILRETWYGARRPGLLLRALESAYRSAAGIRRQRQLNRRCEGLSGRPIVVIGNITAGGSGKTPLVIRLCELLASAGLNAAVISRGYGRRGKGAVVVGPETEAAEAGDEPVLIARSCGVPVFVNADREAAAMSAFDAGAEVVVADDGLQRLSLPRSLEICVVDAKHGLGNERMLPAGPLREPLDRLDRVDYIVINGHGDPVGGRAATRMELEADNFHEVGGERRLRPPEMVQYCRGKRVHAIAGIAFPERFFETLAGLGIAVDHHHSFPDHHAYSRRDFHAMRGIVLMTDKDAVKCTGFSLDDSWSLTVRARLSPDFERAVIAHLQHLAGREERT